MQQPFDALAELDKIAQRQRQEQDAAKTVEAARAAIVLDRDPKRCFFKVVTLSLDTEPSWEVETASVNGTRIRYNPGFVAGLSFPEAVGVMCGHEPLHCCFGHHARRGSRDPEQWNIACDLAVNQVCREAGFTLPSTALFPGVGPYAGFPLDLSAEEYYSLLPDKPQGGQPGEGEAKDPGGCGAVEDASSDEAGNQQAAQQWERRASQAAELADQRQKGSLPGALQRLVEEILHPKIPWTDILRDFISRTFDARDDYSWMFPNRRYMAQGMLLPGLRSQGVGHIVVAVDTSGSIGPETLEKFNGELNGVLESRPCRVTVLYCDDAVNKVVEWTPADGPLTLEALGGGGTSHRPVFEWIERECDEEPVCVVCLTDLWTDFPPHEPSAPVLWALPEHGSNRQPPFGQVLKIDD